jgi:amidase
MTNNTDLAFTPALEQAQLIRDRSISPLELVKLYLVVCQFCFEE